VEKTNDKMKKSGWSNKYTDHAGAQVELAHGKIAEGGYEPDKIEQGPESHAKAEKSEITVSFDAP